MLNGGEGQNRTVDTTIFSRMLYQLSYLATRSRETACGSSQLYQTSHMDATSRASLWGQFGAAIGAGTFVGLLALLAANWD